MQYLTEIYTLEFYEAKLKQIAEFRDIKIERAKENIKNVNYLKQEIATINSDYETELKQVENNWAIANTLRQLEEWLNFLYQVACGDRTMQDEAQSLLAKIYKSFEASYGELYTKEKNHKKNKTKLAIANLMISQVTNNQGLSDSKIVKKVLQFIDEV